MKKIIALFLLFWLPDSYFSQDSVQKISLEEVAISIIRVKALAPFTESSLDEAQIQQQYFGQEMPVLLARTPSVTWVSDGGNFSGYSYFRLRGIDQTRINFTLNGVPLCEPEDQGAYFSNFPDFLSSIRSVQMQRGVGTSTNGTASFGGAVSLESVSLQDSAYTELNASIGSFNSYRLNGEFNTGVLPSKWAFYGRYSNTSSDGFREHSGSAGQSFFYSAAYFMPKALLKLTGFSGFSENQMAYLAAPDSLLKINYRANLLTRDEKDRFSQNLAMLQYSRQSGYHQLNATVFYNRLEGGYSIMFSPDLYRFAVASHYYGSLLSYQYQRQHFYLATGLNASSYARDHFSSILPAESTLLYLNTGHKQEFSSFAKLNYRLNRLNFYADLQYRLVYFRYEPDQFAGVGAQDINWQFFNPKAGVNYRFLHSRLYLSFGKTSREPTRNDLFAGYDNLDSLNYPEIGTFSRVKPESVMDLEAGYKIDRTGIKGELNLYAMEFRQEIAAIGQLSYIGLPLRKNVAASYRRGLELNLLARINKHFRVSAQVNAGKNRIKSYTTDYDSLTYTNVKPLLTPELIANLGLIYQPVKTLELSLDGRYVSASYLDNTNNALYQVPEVFLLNAALRWQFLKNHSVELVANNLLNRKYYTSGYVQSGQSWYFAMATRSAFLTFKFRF